MVALACSCAYSEIFVVHYIEDKRLIPVRIELNLEQQTEHVLSSTGGETLYDFSQGKVAYKDRNSNQCFLANITKESLEGDRRRLKNLRNGVVPSFYLPTFIIGEDSINDTQLWKKLGARLAQFCDGNSVAVVEREQKHRRKRETSEEKGRFTHHSYGHYGHQSNNYAHYGHETYVTGSVDKDGQHVTHQQVPSKSSSGYPDRGSGNGPQSSTTGIGPQMQTQYQMPSYQETSGGNSRNFGTGGSTQLSLQTAQESGYQLNLPLGLSASNTYRGGIRSTGQYGPGLQPHTTTEYLKYPSSKHSQIYRPSDQTRLDQISPSVPTSPIKTPEDYTKIRDRTVSSGYHDLNQTPLTHELPGTRLGKVSTVPHPISSTTAGEQRVEAPTAVRGETLGFQTDYRSFIPSGQRQPGADLNDVSRDDRISRHRLPPIDQPGMPLPRIQAPIYHPGISAPSIHASETKVQIPLDLSRVRTAPGTSYSGPDIHTPSFHPGVGIPSIHRPSILVPSPSGTFEGINTGFQTERGISGTQTMGMQPMTRTPSHQTSGIQPALRYPQQSSMTHRREYGINGNIGRTQVPGLHPPTTILGHPHSDRWDLTQTTHPTLTDSTRPGAVRFDHTKNGIQYTGSLHQQHTERGGTHTGLDTPSLVSGIPVDSRSITGVKPGEVQFLPREARPPSSEQTGYQIPTGPGGIVPRIPGDGTGTHSNGVRPGDVQFLPSGIGHTFPEQTRRYPTELRPEPGGTVLGIPGDNKDTPITGVRPGDVPLLPRGTGPTTPEQTRGYQISTSRLGSEGKIPESAIQDARITSGGTIPTLIAPRERILTDQLGPRSTGQDSAASQTQIQTGLEGTAAEASATGQYRGLGSQTHVQGGYVGNGSFSAQAQSGFTSGVVQSQVQGSKLGGLSGSSAQVERVGSAQSQVQVGQPSGAASSSAQGRFLGGTTQVQAQSGKTGGSAGAQAQSIGLSSSHVQVNIGGDNVSGQEKFQGTVSASVQGGHSSGQSQTQLQGGYESGRTYVATAQGGFDSSSGFQLSVSPSSLKGVSNPTVGKGQPFGAISNQDLLQTASGRSAVGSQAYRTSPRNDLDGKQTETLALKPRYSTVDQTTHTQPTILQPDQYSGKVPQQQFPVKASFQRTLYPPLSQPVSIQEANVQYPSLKSDTQKPSHVLSSPQITGNLYPGYPTDVTGISTGMMNENRRTEGSGIPGFRRYDQSGILPLDLTQGSQQKQAPEGSFYQGGALKPSIYLPRAIPEIPNVYQDLPRQQQGAFSQIPYPPTLGSRHLPGYQPSLDSPIQRPYLKKDEMTDFRPNQLPGLETGHYPAPSYNPNQSPTWLPSLQTTPSHIHPNERSVWTSPGAFSHFGLQPQPSMHIGPHQPGQIQPHLDEQSVLTSPTAVPHSGLQPPPLSNIGLQQTDKMQPRPDEQSVLTSPSSIPHGGLQPPPLSYTGKIQPQTTPRVTTPGILSSTATTDITRAEQPGVSEPDTRNCCEVLRDLKRRCCGRTSKIGEGSSCCKSASNDEIFDFSSEDDENKQDEPCKIVKAICYIVYKPVGKARICKPTQTNGC